MKACGKWKSEREEKTEKGADLKRQKREEEEEEREKKQKKREQEREKQRRKKGKKKKRKQRKKMMMKMMMKAIQSDFSLLETKRWSDEYYEGRRTEEKERKWQNKEPKFERVNKDQKKRKRLKRD